MSTLMQTFRRSAHDHRFVFPSDNALKRRRWPRFALPIAMGLVDVVGLLVVVGQVVAVVAKLCSGAVVVKISFSVAKSISGIFSSLWMLLFSFGSDRVTKLSTDRRQSSGRVTLATGD